MRTTRDRGGMRRRLPAAAALAFVLALTFVMALGTGCDSERAGAPGGSRSRADQEIDGFTLTQTQEGTRVWSLSAENALVYEDADRVELTTLRIDFFDDKGEVRSTLTADEGVLERRTNDIEVLGDVVVYAADGTILTTEKLTWNEMTGKIESDREVRVTKGKDVMTGVGVEADPDLRNIRVMSEFKAWVRTPEGNLVEEE